MGFLVNEYIDYLKNQKKLSSSTLQSYKKDIEQYIEYLDDMKCDVKKKTSKSTIVMYLLYLKSSNKKTTTISRKLASIRSFYQYLLSINLISEDPTEYLESPKIEKKKPEILTQSEIENLLNQPECTNQKGIRDKAMLELICATGIRVSELTSLNLEDINWDENIIYCGSDDTKRALWISNYVLKCLSNYIHNSRNGDQKESALFLNIYGKRITRQGFWKIIKFYKNKASIEKDVTPHTLRHSLAVKLIKSGKNLKEIKNILGFKDESSANIYKNMRLAQLD
ncbi:MAG: tyrosine-type recombinase/integrase [Clostridiales bacterium]|nr:tyrosine-type recombinase/integrase [Clostridiales bacterium]